MMEYMATGRPVIGSYATGHRDVLSPENALLLKDLRPEKLLINGRTFADWVSPSVDEVVAAVEYAYHHRDAIQELGRRAASDMLRCTWEQSARNALRLMGIA
jgi:glycosyltransferase involved in cell wall biosynthesis